MAAKIQWTPWVVPNGGIDESVSEHELPANRWKTALDVEPIPGGCRRRKGKTLVNAVSLYKIIESYTGGTTALNFGDAATIYASQGFTPTADRSVIQIAAIFKKQGNPPTSISAAIYSNNAGAPNVAIAGAGFSDFNSVFKAGIQTFFKWYLFRLSTPVTLTNGVQYHLVFKSSAAGSVGNQFYVECSGAGNPYSGGYVNTSTDGSAWAADTNNDLDFRVYVGSGAITGMIHYRLSDAVTERFVVVHDEELYRESGGTMTLLSGQDRVGLTPSDSTFPTMNVGQDKLFVSNGIDTPRKFYILSGTERFENDGIAPPTAVPTVATVGGGSLAVGTWYVDYYYWNDDLQIASNTKYQGDSSVAPSTVTNGGKSIQITNLPADVVRVGDRATHIRISLKSPSSGIFRFAGTGQGQVALGTTTTTITSDATTNEPDYDNDVALVHTMAVVGANQRFIAGLSATPWRVMASKISGINSFYESFPSLNYRDMGKGDGDYVTALFFIPPSTLIVGMKNSVWALDARRFLVSDAVKIGRHVGIAGKHAGVVVGRNLYFSSDAERTKGLFYWDGGEIQPLLQLDSTFKGLDVTTLSLNSSAQNAPGDGRFQWWLLTRRAGSGGNDRVLMYDYAMNSFSVYAHSGTVLGLYSPSSAVSTIRIGNSAGQIYNADTGNDDAGAAINASVTMRRNDYGLPDTVKRIRAIRMEGKAGQTPSLGIKGEADTEGFASFSTSLDFRSMGGGVLDTDRLDSFILGGSAKITKRSFLTGLSRGVQVTFNSSTDWEAYGYSIALQPTGRRT